MFAKFNLANVFVNKSFKEGEEAVKYHTNENNTPTVCTFQVSGSYYDSKAENKKRYVKFNCKAFGSMAERIQKMKLSAGGNINICGKLDNDNWTDEDGKKHSVVTLIVDDIEYNGSGKKSSEDNDAPAKAAKADSAPSGTTEEADDAFDDLPF